VVPTLLALEVGLICSGRLALGAAIWAVVGIEIVLSVTTVVRAVVAVRRFRARRTTDVDGWAAAEDALAQLIPRRAAHLVLIEPRLWASLGRWMTGRHDGARSSAAFRYDHQLRLLLWTAVALVVIEGAALELILGLLVRDRIWLLVSVAMHLYAVCGLLGLLAGFVTRPHVIDQHALRIRDGIFTEVTIPLSAIRRVRRISGPGFGRSGLKIEPAAHCATLAHGDATIELTVDATSPTLVTPPPRATTDIVAWRITVDDPGAFMRELKAHCEAAAAGASA